MRNIKALLFKLDEDGVLRVRGPVSAEKARGMEADYVILMCDFNTMNDARHKREVDIFRSCLSSSPIYASDQKQMKTLGYTMGTLAGTEIPDFLFESVVYEGF